MLAHCICFMLLLHPRARVVIEGIRAVCPLSETVADSTRLMQFVRFNKLIRLLRPCNLSTKGLQLHVLFKVPFDAAAILDIPDKTARHDRCRLLSTAFHGAGLPAFPTTPLPYFYC